MSRPEHRYWIILFIVLMFAAAIVDQLTSKPKPDPYAGMVGTALYNGALRTSE